MNQNNIDNEIKYFDINELEDYIVCPAKAVINKIHSNRPIKEHIREGMRYGLNDLTIRSLDKTSIDTKQIHRVVSVIFKNLDYKDRDKDISNLIVLYENLNKMLLEHEYTITGSVMPFELSYNGIILKSSIDLVVKDVKRNLKYPVIVDFSKTKYEPFYNPIVYRCQTVADHLQIGGTNTEVVVMSIASGKRWFFEKTKYKNLLNASIKETLECMALDLYPARMSWICAGCAYRGICHKLIKL